MSEGGSLMGAKHTPGPWWAVYNGYFWDISLQNREYAHSVGNTCASSRVTAEANARLIAASPDLLAALEAFMKQYNACGPNSGPGRVFSVVDKLARAAIAKAEGAAQ